MTITDEWDRRTALVRITHEARQISESDFLEDRGYHNRGYHVVQGTFEDRWPHLFPGLDPSLEGPDGSLFFRGSPDISWETSKPVWMRFTESVAVHLIEASSAADVINHEEHYRDHPLFPLVALGVPGGVIVPDLARKLSGELRNTPIPPGFFDRMITYSSRPDTVWEAMKHLLEKAAEQNGMVLFR